MDLENFVSSALVQIVKGVNQARHELKDTGALVNPSLSAKPATAVRHGRGWQQVREIAFDVAVTVADERSGKGGAGITVFGAHLGADGELTRENSTASRVRFVVPLALPVSGTDLTDKENEEFNKPLPYGKSGAI